MRRLGSVHLAPARNARDLPEDHVQHPPGSGKKCIRSIRQEMHASTWLARNAFDLPRDPVRHPP